MRTKYNWYIRPTEDEIKKIWEKGILTVDANVLLDLYRYNESTRNSLITGLEQFKDRIWLSHQASSEFFKNRNTVIVSVAKAFKEASGEVGKLSSNLESSISQLKGNRIVPKVVTDQLYQTVNEAIATTGKEIEKSNSNYPDYLKEDPILDKLLNLFEGAVGDDFPEADVEAIIKEGKRRVEEQIPPGYLDDDKDGNRQCGDYCLWRQVLEYAKQKQCPLIFVTSERKEDWWEKPSGKTVGPRPELLREAMEYSNQRILMYRTERFLEFSAEKSGQEVDKDAVEEIKAINVSRPTIGNAVEIVSQTTEVASSNENKGTMEVNLIRPLYKFTCSGHLDPNMDSPPDVRIRLLRAPSNMPAYKLGAGTGTEFDFNAHIKSTDYEVYLPTGIYVFEYTAKCQEIECEKPYTEEKI